LGHQDFGVYAEVIETGPVFIGDQVKVLLTYASFSSASPKSPDAHALEKGRMLFAGETLFVKGVVAMDGLPTC